MLIILKNLKTKMPVLGVCLFLVTGFAYSQVTYKIQETKDIDMKLLGTSTLHNWSMDAKTAEGEAQFEFEGHENKLTGIKSLTFSVEVEDLKSDKKGLDKNAYKALKTDQYKDVHYKLQSATISPDGENKYLVKANGKLTIAGVTKEVTMDVYCVINKNATISCTGSDKLNMTDYNVKPPTFMLGAMKTGDEITFKFTLVFKKEKGI